MSINMRCLSRPKRIFRGRGELEIKLSFLIHLEVKLIFKMLRIYKGEVIRKRIIVRRIGKQKSNDDIKIYVVHFCEEILQTLSHICVYYS